MLAIHRAAACRSLWKPILNWATKRRTDSILISTPTAAVMSLEALAVDEDEDMGVCMCLCVCVEMKIYKPLSVVFWPGSNVWVQQTHKSCAESCLVY